MIPSQNIKDESFGMNNDNFRLSSSNPFAAGILDSNTFPEQEIRNQRENSNQPIKVRDRPYLI